MVADVRLEEYKSWHICSTIDFKGHTGGNILAQVIAQLGKYLI